MKVSVIRVGVAVSLIALWGCNLFISFRVVEQSGAVFSSNSSPFLPVRGAQRDIIEEESKNDVLHIVTTRFMQHQPHLVDLGLARLELWETFCLPTMMHQRTNNFLWFILTDPRLPSILLSRLINQVSGHDNFYVIASNNSTTDVLDQIRHGRPQTIVRSGSLSHLHTKLNVRPSLLLYTRLDADDGLHERTLAALQSRARNMSRHTEWQALCADFHLEWRSSISFHNHNTSNNSSGKLRLVQEDICVTPGLTFATRPNQPLRHHIPTPPHILHHVINRDWAQCDADSTNQTNCYARLNRYPAAIRSRTLTSAGMSRIEGNGTKDYDNVTNLLWPFLQRDFGIFPQATSEISMYLHEHQRSIVLDNLRGQCAQGHSCKKSSREKLEMILNRTGVANATIA